jgi:hypothetical protein
MPRRYSADYLHMRPFVVEEARAIANAVLGAGAGGNAAAALTAHRLNDTTYHLGQLDPSQATWALTAARQVIAGAGLTGGGTLSGDVTLTIGAGAGITVNADDVALTTPGSLTVSSTNSATGSHTHAVTASSDVGTSPAAALLKSTAGGGLTLASLAVKGSIDVTNGGDLTVGTNILFVDNSQYNVGINCSPDPQFDLDVNGNLRATYIVGKHAIQLKNVVLLAHYDGRTPYETNYTGEPNGHMGQVAGVIGGTIYRPGKFYKAVQVGESGYNYCPNPSVETDATGWSAQYNGGTLTSQARSTEQALYGVYSVKMTASAASTYTFNQPHYHAPDSVTMTWNNTETATISCYVRGSGTWRVVFEDSGQNLRSYQQVTLADTDDWQRVVLTATNSSGSNYSAIRAAFFPWSSSCTIYVDAVHYEKTARATAYIDASLSNGLNTGHGTTGSYFYRNAAGLYYTQSMPAKWSLMFWAYRAAWQAYSYGYLLQWGDNNSSVYYNASNQDVIGGVTAAAPADGWHHYCLIYDGTQTRVYRDGEYVGVHGYTPAAATYLYVGYNGAGAQCNALIDDLCLLDRAMTVDGSGNCAELRAVYESDAPVFAESSRFNFRATPKGLVWADDDGLWVRATDGDTVLGVYGNDAATKSWGGQTMSAGDLLIGNSSAYAFWDDSAATLSVKGAITADSGSLTGFLTLGSSGGIYQGTGTAASPTTGLKIWNDTGVGRIGAYNAGELQWFNSTTGYLYAGRNETASTTQGADRWGVRIARDGVRLLAEATTSFSQSTSASSIRWIFNSTDDIDATLSTATSYASLYAYNNTSLNIVYSGMTTFVGSGVYTTKDATVYLSAQHYTGSTYRGVDFTLTCTKSTGVTYAYCNADEFQIPKVLKMDEMTAPSAPGANKVVIFARDNGAGKTQLCALFSSGAIQQLAIQP